jgi:hypothetical protein
MSLNARQIAKDCLIHIGSTLSASTPFGGSGTDNLPVGCEDYLVNTFNLAIEEIRRERPELFRKTIGAVFEEPKTGTVSVTQASTSLYLGTMEAPAGDGCSIQIDGDPVRNELRASGSELGDYILTHAFGGTTGTNNATIWGDSAVMDSSVGRVLGGIILADKRCLGVVNNRLDLLHYRSQWGGDYGGGATTNFSNERCPGVPEVVWVENYFDPDEQVMQKRLRCAPMPNAQYAIELEVEIIPQELVSADLNEGAVFTFPVPGGLDFTIFRALVIYHWSGSPWFAAKDSVKERIDEAYGNAIKTLRNWTQHSESGCQLVTQGYGPL